MQEYINGLVLIGDKLVKKNFLIKDGLIFFDYKASAHQIDLEGLVVAPGFVDIHVHTRTPGFTHKEDIEHVSQAALQGGVTTMVAMSNTNPMPYDEDSWNLVNELAKKSQVNIIQSARITFDNKLTDFEKLSKLTNCFTDDGNPISDDSLMKQALIQAKKYNVVLMLHEEDHNLKGVTYNSEFAQSNELPSFNSEYESKIIGRDIELNKDINAHIHLQHISTKEGVQMFVEAKKAGMNISAEATPHHLFFNNRVIKNEGNFKMNPPIGSSEDQEALVKAFLNEEINIIATDHAPHTKEEKSGGFKNAANGIIGLETAFAVCNTKLGQQNLEKVLRALTINPAKLIKKDIEIKNGAKANIVIIDPNEEWIFTEDDIKSKSQNSPWIGNKLKGRVKKVIFAKEQNE